MKTKLVNAFAALSIGILFSTSSSVIPRSRLTLQKSALPLECRHSSEHESVAKYYERAAAQLQAKIKEQKELLEQYENKSYLYGRQAQDLQSHTAALIRDYEKSVEASTKEAALHRQMAAQAESKSHSQYAVA